MSGRRTRNPAPIARERSARIGPRGGTTTVSERGMVRKNFWLSEPVNELLRRRSFEERRSESDLIREALGLLFRVERR